MASTRYHKHQPLHIYQDPQSAYDFDPAPLPLDFPSYNDENSLHQLENAVPKRQIVFNPPASSPKPSPLKQSSSSPLRAPFANKLNMVQMPPPSLPRYSTDSMEKRSAAAAKFKSGPQKALFTTFASARSSGKENSQPNMLYPAPSPTFDSYGGVAFAPVDTQYGLKSQGKRVLLDAAPVIESRPSKKLKETGETVIPAPDEFPPIHDDGTKPPHSYAMLIGMAILRAPNRRLTLAQIYKWISDNYKFYNASDAGWQNSIRHNLSLNKAFIKQERPKDDPGKGNYWAIEPGMEGTFIKDKHTRKSTASYNEMPQSAPATLLEHPRLPRPAPQLAAAHTAPTLASAPELPRPSTAPLSADSLPKQEPSSDATIPASDNYMPEDLPDDPFAAPLQAIHSSPPPAMHSSPPIPHHQDRDNTPPPVPRFPTSSRTRSHQRKFASMDDSGYFSSLESSAMRAPRTGRLFTSEADRPRIKRGRAEEEIARLRQSSYDSPTKGRGFMGSSAALSAIHSSSPIRRGMPSEASQMLPPLTPAVKLKAPERPPPSVSPNTNLRLHRDRVRELVGSPGRGMVSLDDGLPWSPAFKLENEPLFGDYSGTFDIFADLPLDLTPGAGLGSPVKRSRPSIDRSRSVNVLGEISTPNAQKLNGSPTKKRVSIVAPELESPSKIFPIDSPIKFMGSANASGFDLPQEDFFGAEFLTEEINDFAGMDILQGFQKIGAGAPPAATPAPRNNNSRNNGARPNMGRSFTTQF